MDSDEHAYFMHWICAALTAAHNPDMDMYMTAVEARADVTMSNLTQGVMSVTSKFSMDFGRFGPKPEARFGKISPAEVAHHVR